MCPSISDASVLGHVPEDIEAMSLQVQRDPISIDVTDFGAPRGLHKRGAQ